MNFFFLYTGPMKLVPLMKKPIFQVIPFLNLYIFLYISKSRYIYIYISSIKEEVIDQLP